MIFTFDFNNSKLDIIENSNFINSQLHYLGNTKSCKCHEPFPLLCTLKKCISMKKMGKR